MKNTITQLLSLIFSAIIIVSCNKSEETSRNKSIEVKNDSEGYFKGIIVLEEKDVLGTQSYITYTFNGNDVKREITEKLLKTVSHGMIYKKDQDSVIYYYTKANQTWHTLISKKEFQKWVTDLETPVIDSTVSLNSNFSVKRPFGTIFEPLDSSAANVSSTVVNSVLKNCTSVRCETFLVAAKGAYSCNVWYSEDIKIRPGILEIIEHNQPKSIKTLALQVNYFSPKISGGNTLEKILDKVDKVLVKTQSKLQFSSINYTDKISVDLPQNSQKVSAKDLKMMINPDVESSGHSGGYDD